MDIIFVPLLRLGITLINLYAWALIAYTIMGWLEHFNIINRYNQFVHSVMTFLFRVTEPALTPLRRIIPTPGGIDISPLVLILFLYFIQGVLAQLLIRFPA